MVTMALLLVAHNVYDDMHAADASAEALEQIRENKIDDDRKNISSSPLPGDLEAQQPDTMDIPDYVRDPHKKLPTVEHDGQTYIGTIDIPSLELSLPVISQWSYPRLKIAPCRYQGSPYLNDLIIMAHNYKSHFGRLIDLHIGDEVYFTDVDGNVFRYAVEELETLGKTDVERMLSGDWDLTLYTCTVGGKTRVTVRCKRFDV